MKPNSHTTRNDTIQNQVNSLRFDPILNIWSSQFLGPSPQLSWSKHHTSRSGKVAFYRSTNTYRNVGTTAQYDSKKHEGNIRFHHTIRGYLRPLHFLASSSISGGFAMVSFSLWLRCLTWTKYPRCCPCLLCRNCLPPAPVPIYYPLDMINI